MMDAKQNATCRAIARSMVKNWIEDMQFSDYRDDLMRTLHWDNDRAGEAWDALEEAYTKELRKNK
jgi:hypothetical protein